MNIRTKKGFTLVEIMIVVVIIGLLAAMAIPAFAKVRKNAIAKAMTNDARQVASAIQQIMTQFPTMGTNWSVNYNTNTGILDSAANSSIGLNDNEIRNYVQTIGRGYTFNTINYNGEAGPSNMAFQMRHPQVSPKDVFPMATGTSLNDLCNFDTDGKPTNN
jgi:prepilin-type N-terminal cleavage/methylation domain-containing protein